jgi:hypothetical protein
VHAREVQNPGSMGGKRRRRLECLVSKMCLLARSPAQTLKQLSFILVGLVSKSEGPMCLVWSPHPLPKGKQHQTQDSRHFRDC